MSKFKFTPPSAATHIETPTSPGDGTVSDIKQILFFQSEPGSGNMLSDWQVKQATQQIQNLITKRVQSAINYAIHELNPYLNNELSYEGQVMMTKTLVELEAFTKEAQSKSKGNKQ